MVVDKKVTKTVKKTATVKKTVAKKATETKEAVAKEAIVKKTVTKKVAYTGKTLKVKLVKSPIACTPKQRATVRGLGLTKLNKTMTLQDTPCVRGMINKIIHMVEVTL